MSGDPEPGAWDVFCREREGLFFLACAGDDGFFDNIVDRRGGLGILAREDADIAMCDMVAECSERG